jgi:hypothetical protein
MRFLGIKRQKKNNGGYNGNGLSGFTLLLRPRLRQIGASDAVSGLPVNWY